MSFFCTYQKKRESQKSLVLGDAIKGNKWEACGSRPMRVHRATEQRGIKGSDVPGPEKGTAQKWVLITLYCMYRYWVGSPFTVDDLVPGSAKAVSGPCMYSTVRTKAKPSQPSQPGLVCVQCSTASGFFDTPCLTRRGAASLRSLLSEPPFVRWR